LREWGASESAEWEGGWVEIQGSFDEAQGRAFMKLKGSDRGKTFEETIMNQTYSLDLIAAFLREAGFARVDFSTLSDLSSPAPEPEREPRIVVLARPQ